MKKRLLLVLIVGVSFSPSLFANEGVGPIARSSELEVAGGSACEANATREKMVWDNILNSNPVQKTGVAKVAAAN